MSNREKVLTQLDKSMEAHRTAHHHTLRAARAHRAKLQAELAGPLANPQEAAEPEPVGMPAGLPAQDLSGLYDTAAGE